MHGIGTALIPHSNIHIETLNGYMSGESRRFPPLTCFPLRLSYLYERVSNKRLTWKYLFLIRLGQSEIALH